MPATPAITIERASPRDAGEIAALYLAARNVPYLHVVDVAALDPVSLVGADKVVVTVESLKRIEEWLA